MIYIAAPFFNKRQLEIVVEVENYLRPREFSFFSPRSAGSLKDMSKNKQSQTRSEIYKGNIHAMDSADIMIACVEEKDTGTIFEMGYFAAKEKKIIMFSQKIGTVNVMLAESAYAVCDKVEKLPDSIYGDYNVEIGDLT